MEKASPFWAIIWRLWSNRAWTWFKCSRSLNWSTLWREKTSV